VACVATFNSAGAVEAVLAGVPTIDEGLIAWEMVTAGENQTAPRGYMGWRGRAGWQRRCRGEPVERLLD
jgi:hypothetical protein